MSNMPNSSIVTSEKPSEARKGFHFHFGAIRVAAAIDIASAGAEVAWTRRHGDVVRVQSP